jgi:hypothetical protein
MKTLPMASIAIAACVVLSSAGVALAAQPGTNAGVNCGTSTGPNIPGDRIADWGCGIGEGGSLQFVTTTGGTRNSRWSLR